MFDYIKATYKKGDKLKLTCVNGEFVGEILFITDDSIIIKTFDGKTCGIKGINISFFEELPSSSIQSKDSAENLDNEPSGVLSNGQDSNDDNTISEKVSDQESTIDEKALNEELKSDGFQRIELPGIKIVGKVDLESINQTTRPKKATPKKDKSKPTQTLKGLDSLRILVEDDHKKENKKLVPAIGRIKRAYPDRNFGFISDAKSGKDIYFSFEQLIDPRIVSKSSGYLYELPVIYTIQGNEKGDMALSIHRQGTVNELIKLTNDLVAAGSIKHAIRVLEHILCEYPDNFTAYEFKNKLDRIPTYSSTKSYSTNFYFKAKKFNLDKDYPKAIEYFIKAIEAGVKLESSIKDLGMLYVQLFKQEGDDASEYKERAIELMKEHEDDLPNSISTLYYLENLYYSIKEYKQFIRIAEKLLDNNEFQKDSNRCSQLLCKVAVAYVQTDRINEAKETIEDALSMDSNNVWAIKLKDAMENDNAKDIINAISTSDFDSLISGLSSFIQRTLKEYDEYAGVPAKDIESGDFNINTLKRIRVLIDQFTGRSRDRAKYLLTEAKLMQDIEPENTVRFRTVLGRYCNDMAKIHIADNSSLDVIRFFYNESFSLEENFDNNATNVATSLLTHIYDYRELLEVTTRQVSIDSALKAVIGTDFDIKRWLNVLTMFLYNRVISAKLTSLFFSNAHYRNQAIKALSIFGADIKNNPTKEEFTEAWNIARETLKRYNSRTIASIRAITQSSSLEDMLQQIMSLTELKKDWMCALDINRLSTIINNIVPALSSYLKSSGYRNKEANRNNANGQISQLKEDIMREPTKLSYEEFLPLLDALGQLLSNSFQEVIKMSEPRINTKLLSEQTVVDESGVVRIQIEVSNHKESSPIKEVSVSIDERDDLTIIKSDDIFYNAIEGGESHIFKLQFKVNESIIAQKATVLSITCTYKTGEVTKNATIQHSLKLYSQEEFTPIENPYAPYADGGPMKWDSKMFFGREVEIKNVVDAIIKSPSKQIIIYGQKRSGKSSVLNRIKKSLQDTGKTFCVSFSLGEILQNLNEVTFFYQIISSIKQVLRDYEMDGITNIPTFTIPTQKAFKEEDEDNPLNTFIKYMIEFKHQCKLTEGWQDKMLVVMIDEFTYLYSGIKKGEISESIMKQWKAITQNERAQFSVVLVGQDVVPSFKKEDFARNAFGVIQDMRLTYLKEEPARALIETPILDENGNSRYIGDAVSRIIEYTSRNPYYIQIFCSRLVDFMNKNKSISVTEADVYEVARSFIDGSDALEEDKFDNLIRAGESKDMQEHSEANTMAVLRQIARYSKNIGYCNRTDINVLDNKDEEDAIIKDLYDREVLEMKGENNYKIQVKIFQEWLLNH